MIINNIHKRMLKSGILFTDICIEDFFNRLLYRWYKFLTTDGRGMHHRCINKIRLVNRYMKCFLINFLCPLLAAPHTHFSCCSCWRSKPTEVQLCWSETSTFPSLYLPCRDQTLRNIFRWQSRQNTNWVCFFVLHLWLDLAPTFHAACWRSTTTFL